MTNDCSPTFTSRLKRNWLPCKIWASGVFSSWMLELEGLVPCQMEEDRGVQLLWTQSPSAAKSWWRLYLNRIECSASFTRTLHYACTMDKAATTTRRTNLLFFASFCKLANYVLFHFRIFTQGSKIPRYAIMFGPVFNCSLIWVNDSNKERLKTVSVYPYLDAR